MTVTDIQNMVDAWIEKVGVRYFNEMTNMAILTEEVGELARVMSRKYGEQSFKEGEEQKLSVGEELADILWVVACIANQTGVNLQEEIVKSLEKKNTRDANRHKNNEKLK